jgi:hypothetical protein
MVARNTVWKRIRGSLGYAAAYKFISCDKLSERARKAALAGLYGE